MIQVRRDFLSVLLQKIYIRTFRSHWKRGSVVRLSAATEQANPRWRRFLIPSGGDTSMMEK